MRAESALFPPRGKEINKGKGGDRGRTIAETREQEKMREREKKGGMRYM